MLTAVPLPPVLQEELYNAIVRNDVATVYDKIEEGADVGDALAPACMHACNGHLPIPSGGAWLAVVSWSAGLTLQPVMVGHLPLADHALPSDAITHQMCCR